MKVAIVIHEDARQVMLAPENEFEERALGVFEPDSKVSLEIKQTSFNDKDSVQGYEIGWSQGGALRAYANDKCVMLIVRNKEKTNDN